MKEVTTQVTEAAADCGIIYATDAYSAGLTVVDTATAEMCGQVIYPRRRAQGGQGGRRARLPRLSPDRCRYRPYSNPSASARAIRFAGKI